MTAYDSVECGFLLKVIECLGFYNKRCHLRQCCVSMGRF